MDYVWNVITFGKLHQDLLFPKISKCSFYKYGPSGTIVNIDVMCLLPLNILNDKIYFVLSLWFIGLLLGTIFSTVYWGLHWFIPRLRIYHLKLHLKGRIKGNILKNVNKHFGDWLLLHLLMKNIDRRTFQEIVNKLCNDKCDDKCVKQMKRVLTNISEDLDSKNNSSRLRLKMSNGDEEEDTESQDKFFLPGHGETRKLAVNFESI